MLCSKSGCREKNIHGSFFIKKVNGVIEIVFYGDIIKP
jgi:hypothetical protein